MPGYKLATNEPISEDRDVAGPVFGNVTRRGPLVNGEREPGDASGNDNADWRPVRDNYAPEAGAPEAHRPPPTIRRHPDKRHLEPVAGDVGVWAAGVTSDGRDDAEDVSPRHERDQ